MATAGLAVQEQGGWNRSLVGGVGGLGFAAGLILQNAVLMSGSPAPGADIGDVVRFYTDNSTRVLIASGWVALNAAFFLSFITVVSNRLQESSGSELWGQIGYAAGIGLFPIFATVAYLQVVLVSRVEELGSESAVYSLLWDLHSASFAMTGIALGVLLGAFSIGALAQPIVPRWTAYIGMIGAVLLLASGAFSFNMIDGGPALFAGFAGFAAWILFVIVASLRIIWSPESAD